MKWAENNAKQYVEEIKQHTEILKTNKQELVETMTNALG